jgi:hypothetical protein
MPSQAHVVRGMRKKPFSFAAGVRAQASQLPGLYGMRQQKDFQEKQIAIGEGNLALGERSLAQQSKQFKKQSKMELKAAGVAQGQMFLKGGLSVAKAGMTSGIFDDTMGKASDFFGGGSSSRQGLAAGINPQAYGENQPQVGASDMPDTRSFGRGQGGLTEGVGRPSYGQDFTQGGWKSGAWGGVSGGMMGAGAAKALGAKKKWQTGLAGAGAGMLGTFLAGSSNPFSMALGGALGGGLGMLM